MRITQYQSVCQLTFFPRVFPVNCYLVQEEDGLTLIDAGIALSKRGILEAAANFGQPIKRIVLTHAHSDHVGSLDSLKQHLPDAQVYISERDARLLKGDRSLLEKEAQTPIKGGVPKHIKTNPDVLLKEGDRICSLTAVASPGHTPGSVSFLDERHGILIAGDSYHTRSGITVSGHLKLTFPFPALATWNQEIALESAEKLLDLKPKVLAAGHGSFVYDPAAGMRKAITEAYTSFKRKGD
ncbi:MULTISPECIES: MBL fold metallo-hydrolase [Bacillus]|uniref:MBL fold metallo-hydrolase n=1 Tax=Bacillus TaxID=1386 RepID=UPI000409B13C|nr:MULTISPECIES: MBL fold metallo-hydrolase [Bacillus]QHZ47222.1 MBL fold metallo-hydrolase [Bacillus sp. NSP9.1]WFA07285.1 MBL fold metallo-hydrolase [Bacillus sp. HSf4]